MKLLHEDFRVGFIANSNWCKSGQWHRKTNFIHHSFAGHTQ